MLKTISATKIRNHFDEVMKQVKIAPVIVERSGKAEVVIISKEMYDQLINVKRRANFQKRLSKLHAQIRIELKDKDLLDINKVIHQGRKERDEQLHL